MIEEIRLPEISENIDTAEVVDILVAEGDAVEEEQTIVELETQKAIFEVPSPVAGTIKQILVKVDDTVKVGQVIAKVETEKKKKGKKEQEQEEGKAETELREKEATKEKDTAETGKKEKVEKQKDEEKKEEKESAPETAKQTAVQKSEKPVPASPSVRRFAREIGADIRQVKGSGPHGRISVDDVKSYSKKTRGETSTEYSLPDFTQWGEVHREKMTRVRKLTAEYTAASWQAIPLVTQFDKADVTDLEKFRKKHSRSVEQAGGKLTITAILIKIAARGLKIAPRFNASLDMNTKEIIYKSYTHIGVAVDTPRGLLVPVIRDADQKSLTEISVELTDLAERTRNKKVKPDELEGGNFTISNLGGIGGTYFTPIVYAPQVSILGVGRARQEPVYEDGTWVPHWLMPLALSYDHRILDGADGIRFLRLISESLENPLRLFLEGEMT